MVVHGEDGLDEISLCRADANRRGARRERSASSRSRRESFGLGPRRPGGLTVTERGASDRDPAPRACRRARGRRRMCSRSTPAPRSTSAAARRRSRRASRSRARFSRRAGRWKRRARCVVRAGETSSRVASTSIEFDPGPNLRGQARRTRGANAPPCRSRRSRGRTARAPAPRRFVDALRARAPGDHRRGQTRLAEQGRYPARPRSGGGRARLRGRRRGGDLGADRSSLQGLARRSARRCARRSSFRFCARTSSSTRTSCIEARAAGADCILLIAAMLETRQICARWRARRASSDGGAGRSA